VKSLMVLLKLLILTVTLSSIAACSTSTPYQTSSVSRPVVMPTNGGHSMIVDAVQGLYMVRQYGLSDTQKHKQTAAVHTALESELGKVVHWYERDAMGAVKAVHGYPQGSGYCRVLYSLVTVKGRSKEFTETACRKNYESTEWYFITK
jgi:surface antigen